MIFSLVLNLGMRNYGYYAGKIFIETSIPSQIATFGYISLKILCLNADLFLQGKEMSCGEILICCIISAISLTCASSFLYYFRKIHSDNIVYASYYLWLLCYCFPLGITLVNAGISFSLENYYALVITCGAISYGSYLHTIQEKEIPSNDEEENTLIEI